MPTRKRPWITLTPEQSAKLCTELERRRPKLALAAHLMIYLGLRLNEARLIEHNWIQDLGTPAARLSLPAYATKTHHARDLPIGPATHALILRATAGETQPPLPETQTPTYIITKTSGHPYTHRGIQKSIRHASQRALGFAIRPVALRHTFATQLLKHTNIRVVQVALGHRSLQSTQIYTHPAFNDLRHAMDTAFAPQPEVRP